MFPKTSSTPHLYVLSIHTIMTPLEQTTPTTPVSAAEKSHPFERKCMDEPWLAYKKMYLLHQVMGAHFNQATRKQWAAHRQANRTKGHKGPMKDNLGIQVSGTFILPNKWKYPRNFTTKEAKTMHIHTQTVQKLRQAYYYFTITSTLNQDFATRVLGPFISILDMMTSNTKGWATAYFPSRDLIHQIPFVSLGPSSPSGGSWVCVVLWSLLTS